MQPTTAMGISEEQGQRQFLVQGARSYLDAVTAVTEYRRLVHKKCRNTLEQHLATYSAALGPPIELAPNHLFEVTNPSPEKWNGTGADLSVITRNHDNPPGVSWWYAFASLTWDETSSSSPWFGVCVGLGLSSKKMAATMHRKMQGVCAAELWELEVGIAQELAPEDSADFESRLDELLTKWIAALKQIGGFKVIAA
jgi:hypothetical protein